MSLFDTLHLLYEIYHHHCRHTVDGDSAIRRIQSATRVVVETRLRSHQTREHDNNSNLRSSPQTATLLYRFEKCLYNTPIRHLLSVVLILQYAKLCGFNGIPMSFSLATGYFASWIIMEMILLFGEGRAAMDPAHVALRLPTSDSSSLPIIPKSAGSTAFLLQGIVISFGAFMWLLTRDDFGLAPRHGETAPMFHYRLAVLANIVSWAASCVGLVLGYMFASVVGSKSEKFLSGHNLSSLLMDTAYASLVIIFAKLWGGWIMAVQLPIIAYSMFLSASRLFWRRRGRGEWRGGCWPTGSSGPGSAFSRWAFIYAVGLLLFYILFFNPEGTKKASWTECLP